MSGANLSDDEIDKFTAQLKRAASKREAEELKKALATRLMQQAGRAIDDQQGIAIGGYARPIPPPQSPPRVYNYQEKMEMRMGWQPGCIPNCFAFVEYRMVGEKAFMWILTSDAQSIVLEDDPALFPSDALITKVRMMGG